MPRNTKHQAKQAGGAGREALRRDQMMTLNTIATTVSIVVGLGGLLVAVWQARQSSAYYRSIAPPRPQ